MMIVLGVVVDDEHLFVHTRLYEYRIISDECFGSAKHERLCDMSRSWSQKMP